MASVSLTGDRKSICHWIRVTLMRPLRDDPFVAELIQKKTENRCKSISLPAGAQGRQKSPWAFACPRLPAEQELSVRPGSFLALDIGRSDVNFESGQVRSEIAPFTRNRGNSINVP
jgi:hypothetical protein